MVVVAAGCFSTDCLSTVSSKGLVLLGRQSLIVGSWRSNSVGSRFCCPAGVHENSRAAGLVFGSSVSFDVLFEKVLEV